MPTYSVYADDNFHRHDLDENNRYKLGDYQDCADAIRVCKSHIDQFLAGCDHTLTAERLYSYYQTFGEDPFIRSGDPNCKFSAWDYAWERCQKLTSEQGPAKPAK